MHVRPDWLSQNRLYEVAVNIGQSVISTLESEGQACVIKS